MLDVGGWESEQKNYKKTCSLMYAMWNVTGCFILSLFLINTSLLVVNNQSSY
jgi:hypothetical protein